ncbi:E3 ubiquitin-protein ligase PDZRN3-like isoform X2 [Liolophura sinensis]
MKNRSPTMVSVATQTEEDIYLYSGQVGSPTASQVELGYNAFGLYQPSSRRPVAFAPNSDMGLTDIEMANAVEFEDPYFEDRTFEMEYEEVTLQRTTSEEKLGLTLCYGSAEDEVTDIFISEIEPSSIAALDGRIKEGDQILQINNVDVHNREEAIALFSDAQPDITLLVARPQLQLDDGFMDEHNELLDDPRVELLEQHHHSNMAFTASILRQGRLQFDEEGGTTDTATTENSHKHEKDSGVGRTDESTKNDESSEQDIMDNESLSLRFRHGFNLGKGEHHDSNDSFTSNDLHDRETTTGANEISAEACNKFREVLEHKCNSVENSPRKLGSVQGSQSSLDQELAILNREMEEIQLECEEIVESHLREQGKGLCQAQQDKDSSKADSHRSPRIVPRMGTRMEVLKHVQTPELTDLTWVRKDSTRHPQPITQPGVHCPLSHSLNQDKERDLSTTSAYNTGGESCRSTPLTLELSHVCEGEKGLRSSMLCLASADLNPSLSLSDTEKQTQTLSPVKAREYSSDGTGSLRSSQTATNSVLSNDVTPVQENGNIVAPSESLGESLQDIYARYADVMYTNEANLQHTIAVQQKLFEQQISQKTGKLQRAGGFGAELNSSPSSTLHMPPGPLSPNVPGGESSTQMEWVVKRRPDGTRYITRRPVRNKILKERAKKLAEERCGMTTDDDAMSELKVGRYWSKDDRKKHLEKARDQKRKKEQLIRQRMETLKEGDEKTNLNIVELSHRKMMKHKGKKVFDDFMTVQEMLAHGSKVPSGKTYNPLLSVTTV